MKKYLLMFLLIVACIPKNDLLFVSYMGWYHKMQYTVGWDEVQFKECVGNGKTLKFLTEEIKKKHKFYKVIILNFQRFEGRSE